MIKKRRNRAVSVRVFLKNANEKSTLVLLSVYIDKKRLVWSTGEYVSPSDWSAKSQRPTIRANRPELRSMKGLLDQYEKEAVKLFLDWQLSRSDNARGCDHDKFKQELMYRTGRETRPSEKTEIVDTDFVIFAETYRDNRKLSPSIVRGTWKVINNHVNLLREFADLRCGGSIEFKDLDDVMIDKLKAFLFDVKGHKPSTVNKVLVSMRQVARYASRKGLMKYDDVFREWTKQNFKKRRQPALTKFELQKIIDLDLSSHLKLERVRDLFLIGVATAQRWGDYSSFKQSNFHPIYRRTAQGQLMQPVQLIGYRYTVAAQQKTKGKAEGFVMRFAYPALEKYGYVGSVPFNPIKISRQRFNDYIKDVVKLAIPESKFKVYNDGKRLDHDGEVVPLHTVIGSHAARRTAVGLLKSQGYSDTQVMAMTGHKTLTEMEGYDQRDAETRALDMLNRWSDDEGRLKVV